MKAREDGYIKNLQSPGTNSSCSCYL